MRISQALLGQLATQRTNAAQAAYVGAAQRVSADQRVSRPADDPVAAARLDRISRRLGELDAMGTNRRTVQNDLTAADTIIDGVHERMIRASEIALSMSSDNMNADDRANAAIEVQAIFDQVIGLMNQQQAGGNYLFGGLQDGRPPFDDRGVYQGDQLHRHVQVGPGYSIRATVDGTEVFGAGNEVMSSLSNLMNALNANDGDAIRATIDEVSDGRAQVSRARTDVGTRLATLLDVDELTFDLQTTLEVERNSLQAVDIARGASDLASAQAVLTAVVQTSQAMLQNGSGSWLR